MRIEEKVSYITSAMKRGAKEIGFLPNSIYANALVEGRAIVLIEWEEPVGFALRSHAGVDLRIYQVWVEPEVRKQYRGEALVEWAKLAAVESDARSIIAHVAIDLPAVNFWHQEGFYAAAKREKKSLTRRDAWRMQWRLPGMERYEKWREEEIPNIATPFLLRMDEFRAKWERAIERKWRKLKREASQK